MSRFFTLMATLLIVAVFNSGSLFARAVSQSRTTVATSEKVLLHEEYGTAELLIGSFKTTPGLDHQRQAYELIESRSDLYRIAQPAQELSVMREDVDELGMTHLRFQQKFKGLDVWGCQTIVHFQKDGTIYMVGGQTIATPSIDVTPSVSVSSAQSSALTMVGKEFPTAVTLESKNELIIYPNKGEPKLVWSMTVTSPDRGDVRWNVFVDAQSGAVIDKYDNIQTDNPDVGTGIDVLGNLDTLDIYNFGGTFQLVDATRSMFVAPASNLTGVIVTYDDYYSSGPISTDPDGDKVWDDLTTMKAEVSGHYYARQTYDYFLNTFGWDSYNNSGSSIIVNVHDPLYTNNAYWNGQAINFADGDGSNYKPFSGSLDVVAHELAHGVTEYTAGLIYRDQSGALNESYSDVAGANVDRDDWLLGDDIRISSPGFIRSMQDPNLRGHPKHMTDYRNLNYDNGGVHINSGIPNHAYYQASVLLGRTIAEQVWFRALRFYLTPSSNFYFWAGMVMQSTYDLYGAASAEVAGINTALDLVGLNTAYVLPMTVSAGATLGGVSSTSLWVHNPGPGAKTVTAVPPTFPGMNLNPGPGYQAVIPEGDSSEFEVVLNGTGLDSCDVALAFDTLRFDVAGSIASQIKIPTSISIGYTSFQIQSKSFDNSSLFVTEYNTSKLDRFQRDGNDALYDASLFLGVMDGTSATVYRDVFGLTSMAPVDLIQSANGSESFKIATADGRIQGSVKYSYDTTGADPEYIIASYEFYNLCDTPLTLLSGLYADFDINSSGTNLANFDSANQMIYMNDQADTRACGFALLNGSAKNLWAVNNPTYIWSGLDDAVAYSLLNNNGNLSGLTPDDWSLLLTFGSNVLGAGDTVRYEVAMMYSNAGSSDLVNILGKITSTCCIGVVGNIDCDPGNIVDIADLTALISYLFISPNQTLCCLEEANINGDAQNTIDISDLTGIIIYLFIATNSVLLPCQ